LAFSRPLLALVSGAVSIGWRAPLGHRLVVLLMITNCVLVLQLLSLPLFFAFSAGQFTRC
jgi:hypothetical protein